MASEARLTIFSPSPPPPLQFPFLHLPAELRNKIYEYAVSWPSIRANNPPEASQQNLLKQRCQDQDQLIHPCPVSKPYFGRLHTPSLLLVNRQISAEAVSILYQTPFVIDSSLLYHFRLHSMDIQTFVSETTLRRMRFVVFDMQSNFRPAQIYFNSREWLNTIERLSCIWNVGCGLQKVVVKARYREPSKRLGWTFGQARNHTRVMAISGILRRLGERVDVVFEGGSPGLGDVGTGNGRIEELGHVEPERVRKIN